MSDPGRGRATPFPATPTVKFLEARTGRHWAPAPCPANSLQHLKIFINGCGITPSGRGSWVCSREVTGPVV